MRVLSRSIALVCGAAVFAGCSQTTTDAPRMADSEVPAAWGTTGTPAPTWRPATAEPLAAPLPITNPYADRDAAAVDGERLWNWYNCAGCHSPGAGGGMGPPLIDAEWIYGGDDARVFESVWEGRPAGMPAWAGIIPQDDVWKIIAFLRHAPRRDAWPWNETAPPEVNTAERAPVPPSSPPSSEPRSAEAIRIEITARQWWWDIVYADAAGTWLVRTANELHLPVAQQTRLIVRGGDVPQRFCAAVGEEVEVEAGKEQIVEVRVDQPGYSVGVCRQFLGTPDDRMQFALVGESQAEFDAWLERQRGPATKRFDEAATRGQQAFMQRCSVCHTVRGTTARGRVAPDLTHVASRQRIANGALTSRVGDFEAWIAGNETIKPGNLMPSFKELDGVTLRALGSYLAALR